MAFAAYPRYGHGHDEREAIFGDVQAGQGDSKNTVRYAEKAEDRRPVVGTAYLDRYKLPKPHPQRIRLTIEPAE